MSDRMTVKQELRTRIEQLESVRDTLSLEVNTLRVTLAETEATVSSLQAENEQLRTENAMLKASALRSIDAPSAS